MIDCIFEDGGKGSLRHVATQVIIFKEGKILLIKRAEGMLEGGKWALSGGFVDRDETLEEAMAREVMEETGWTVKNIKLLSIYDNPDRPNENRQNIAFNYSCEAVEKIGESDKEVADVRWVSLTDPLLQELAFDHTKVVTDFLGKYTE